jgi:hypothetical protein
MYGRGRTNVQHLGDWLINQFPMSTPTDEGQLQIGEEIWNELPLDRTIQFIQRYKNVLSSRLHPLLCALTSAETVAYTEQPAGGETSIISGKFRSMLIDIFGRNFPEKTFFPVDRGAVTRGGGSTAIPPPLGRSLKRSCATWRQRLLLDPVRTAAPRPFAARTRVRARGVRRADRSAIRPAGTSPARAATTSRWSGRTLEAHSAAPGSRLRPGRMTLTPPGL